MNKHYYYFAMLLFAGLFAGCMKQSPEEMMEEKTPSVYMLNMETMEAIPVSPSLFNNLKSLEKSTDTRNPNSSTNGIFNTVAGATCAFNAMQNNSGMHGNSHIGGSVGIVSLHFNSDCLSTNGNEAYFGGEITSMELEEGVEVGFDVGFSFFTGVKDGGQGNNADPDMYARVSWITEPGTTPESEGYGPFETWCDFWNAVYNGYEDPTFFYFIDGVNPTNVKVNE